MNRKCLSVKFSILPRFSAIFVMALLVSACFTDHHSGIVQTADAPIRLANFNQALAHSYNRVYSGDFPNFSQNLKGFKQLHRKKQLAQGGALVLPELVEDYDISVEDVGMMTDARLRLMTVLNLNARIKAREHAALAQALFDCWLEQQSNKEYWYISKAAPPSCKPLFFQNLQAAESVVRPPRKVRRPSPALIDKTESIYYPQRRSAYREPNHPEHSHRHSHPHHGHDRHHKDHHSHDARPHARDHMRLPHRESEAMHHNQEFIIYFGFDSEKLDDPAKAVVANVATAANIQENTSRILLIGHADTVGPASYNQGLSERRARSVRAELVRLGISPSRIQVDGRGETDLRVQTPDGVAEAQNRRVEASIVIRMQ